MLKVVKQEEHVSVSESENEDDSSLQTLKIGRGQAFVFPEKEANDLTDAFHEDRRHRPWAIGDRVLCRHLENEKRSRGNVYYPAKILHAGYPTYGEEVKIGPIYTVHYEVSSGSIIV